MRILAIVLALLVLWSCDPVKRVLGDPEKKDRIKADLLKEGICRPDTFLLVVTDTLVAVDTIGVVVTQTDTLVTFDTVRITQTKWRDILKTVTIRDTLLRTVEDRAQVEALKAETIELKARLSERKGKDFDSMLWIAIAGAVMGGTGMYLIRR